MLHSASKISLAAALFGLMLLPSVSWGQVKQVKDGASLFSKEAVAKANAIVAQVKEKTGRELLIETVAEGVQGGDKERKAFAKGRMGKSEGVYIVVSANPRYYWIEVTEATLTQGFKRSDITKLEDILKSNLAKNPDEALLQAANYTLTTLSGHAPAAKVDPAPAPKVQPDRAPAAVAVKPTELPPWVGWLCIGLAALFVIWLVLAIIRGITSMAGGGGGAPGYGGGGGGGGGFMTGLFGGLFGSMAGMWIYNNMFGGHSNAYGAGGGYNQGYGGGGASGGGDWDADKKVIDDDKDVGGKEVGGKEVGDDGGGAGGGGDWGGGDAGGDTGGGGDWGGGGGGGGDWGGGGGGDGGGGGGDW